MPDESVSAEMSSPASGPFDAAIAHPEEPLGMITEPDDQELERAYSLLWTPVHEKAHVVLPTSVKLTRDEFLAQNQHWLDLLLRVPSA